MSRKSENVKSPKTDFPDLIPEGLVGVQGTPGDPWEPLKHPKTLEFPGFPGFREFSLNSPVGPYWALGPPQALLESNPENPFLDFQLLQIFESFFVDFCVFCGILGLQDPSGWLWDEILLL